MSRVQALVEDAAVDTPARESEHVRYVYWVLGGLILIYVALCTPNRDSLWGADAWEHHRAIVALTENLWQPGNPTYATGEPSIRYSPYSVVLALICRTTGLDAYDVLSGAAVVNTTLLIVALFILLCAYGMTAMGPYVLIVMVSLYGQAPGYANSYALSDLPWHQVNPSAFSFGLTLLMWTLFRRTAMKPRPWAAMAVIAIMGAVSTLTHGHTGVFAFIGMAAIAVSVPGTSRVRLIGRVVIIGAGSFLLCAAWPWFDFLDAVLNNRDQAYWFNPGVTRTILTSWSAPALFCLPILLSLRRNELARFCLIGAVASFGLGLLSFIPKSSLLARLPMPALVLLHIPIALYIYRHEVFVPGRWRRMGRDLLSFQPAVFAPACINTLLAAGLAYCLIPQLAAIPRDPALARTYFAPVMGKIDKQLRLEDKFADLLQPVGRREVVLSDVISSWPVPSFRGRIVAALHYETFTPDQPARERAVETFFATKDLLTRQKILRDYDVRWILLSRTHMPESVVEELLEPAAVVKQVDGTWILMDADRWLQARTRTAAQLTHQSELDR